MKKTIFSKGDNVVVTLVDGKSVTGTVLFYDRKWNDYGVKLSTGDNIMVFPHNIKLNK